MSNLAYSYDNIAKDVESLSNIVDKMSMDNDFAQEIIVSKNIRETLKNYGFDLQGIVLESFEKTIEKIKLNTAKELNSLQDKISEIVNVYHSGNGAGGWD